MINRLILAALASSVVVVTSIAVVMFLISAAAPGPSYPVRAWISGLQFPLIFGWPIALGATAGIGVPVYLVLQRRTAVVSSRTVIVLGMLLGGLLWVAFWREFSGSFNEWWLSAAEGAVGGAAGGSCFWRIARKK